MDITEMSGCEYIKCPYASRVEGKPYCTDEREFRNADGELVCGMRADAILVEQEAADGSEQD